MTALHLDLHEHLGCQGNIPTYAQGSGNVRREKTRAIQGLHWHPGPVVFPLQFSLLIFKQQPQRILHFWDVLEYNFCKLPEISCMYLDYSGALHGLDGGLEYDQR